jgi:predicted nucleic acid-binding protein
LIAYVQGAAGPDVEAFDSALGVGDIVISPVVLTEVLSDEQLPPEHRDMVLEFTIHELHSGYWVRAAAIRSTLLARQLRARLPDALIAQSCIDHDVALITRDRDFRHFAKH